MDQFVFCHFKCTQTQLKFALVVVSSRELDESLDRRIKNFVKLLEGS